MGSVVQNDVTNAEGQRDRSFKTVPKMFTEMFYSARDLIWSVIRSTQFI